MFLVLCDPHDVAALWAYEHLRQSLGSELQLVTTGMLAAALSWEHEITNDETSFRIELADRRVIESHSVRGVLNRLLEAPVAHWSQASEVDRQYVVQEISAFYLSWLHGLTCPVYNPATPQGLCGQWRQESEWVMLAAEVGLPTPPYLHSTREKATDAPGCRQRLRRAGETIYTAIVLDDLVTGLQLPPTLAQGCRDLAQLSRTPLLGVEFVVRADGALRFAGATPFPNLRLGGRALIHALSQALRGACTEVTHPVR